MSTFRQLVRRNRKFNLRVYNRSPKMRGCPQKQGTVIRLGTISPKKPNSAVRQLAKVKLGDGYKVRAVIPGSGHDISVFANVWLHAKRTRDMPGVHYRLIRGKGDLLAPDKFQRQNRRSIFSVPNWTYMVLHEKTRRPVFIVSKRQHVRNSYEREAGLPLTSTRGRYYISRELKLWGAAHPRKKKKRWLTRQDHRDRRRRRARFEGREFDEKYDHYK